MTTLSLPPFSRSMLSLVNVLIGLCCRACILLAIRLPPAVALALEFAQRRSSCT